MARGWGKRTAGTTPANQTNFKRLRGRCCVKRSKEVRPRRLTKSPPTPQGGGEKPSRQAPATAHANIQDYSFQTRQFRGRRKKGVGGPQPLKPLPPPCLPTFSEPPCHRTSSSWKLPLGSALRMPNSISQGACQQPGWGLRNTATATGAAPGHPALPLPTLWFSESCRTVP